MVFKIGSARSGLHSERMLPTEFTQRAFDALKAFKGQAAALEALANYLLVRDK